MNGGFYQVFPVADLADDVFFLIFVIFVVDLSYDLLQDILQSDKAGRIAVFIQYDGHVKGSLTHLHQQFGDAFVFIGKVGLS